MFSARAIFRFVYNSSYVALCVLTAALLLVTPGDIVYQAYENRQDYNIWTLVAAVVFTMLLVSFIYALRLYNNKTILASIPKSWVPIEKGDMPKRVFKMVSAGLDRSSAITFEARPRSFPNDADAEPEGDQGGVGAGGGGGGVQDQDRQGAGSARSPRPAIKAVVKSKLGLTLPADRAPIWGDIEHYGWSPPDSPDLPNLQYSTVLSELPHLIEAKALTLAPPDPATAGNDPPLLDPEAVALLERPPALSLRQYLVHLSELGVLPMGETADKFLTLHEYARFSNQPMSNEQFRQLMQLFALLLRSMQPFDPTVLDFPDSDGEEEQWVTPSDSDIDNDAPKSLVSRSGTQSTHSSGRRQLAPRPSVTARNSSAGTRYQYRTAPSTLPARSTGPVSSSSSLNSFAQSRQPYYAASSGSLRSKASAQSQGSNSSVIRLAGRTDPTDLPYVLTLTDSR